MSLEGRCREVLERIAAAAARAGRDPSEITLIAVSKSFPVTAVSDAIERGIRDFGENRAQELRDKAAVIGDRVRWHFIGHLQTNKVRHVVRTAALIHSVDRFGLAEAIDRRARALGVVQPVLIEVNVSGEASKHGVEPARAVALAAEVADLEAVELGGVMTMPPFPQKPEDSRPFYEQLRLLRDHIVTAYPGATDVSMGMSRDYEVAIEEGSTMVRIGEALFGPRRKSR